MLMFYPQFELNLKNKDKTNLILTVFFKLKFKFNFFLSLIYMFKRLGS